MPPPAAGSQFARAAMGEGPVLPHNCRRLAASSAKPIFEGTQPRARSGGL